VTGLWNSEYLYPFDHDLPIDPTSYNKELLNLIATLGSDANFIVFGDK
jgi:hypothetical protein